MDSLPQRQRVAAYAVMLRERAGAVEILLSRLAPYISRRELWTLPGGGLDHGEDPRAALVREIWEEAGLEAEVGEAARVYSAHVPRAHRDGELVDAHAIRIVYDAWVAPDAPAPRVVEVDGSTVEAAWHPLAAVVAGLVPVVSMVTEAIADHGPFRMQRVAAYGLAVRDGHVLLTELSSRAARPGHWNLPGGGVEHGESPAEALQREMTEETGLPCEVGPLVAVHDTHFEGTAPSGRVEDYHGIHLVYAVTVGQGTPRVAHQDLTTERVEWVEVSRVETGELPVLGVVSQALSARG
jgi:8-oxo-dGTP diphosphatase